MLNKLANRVCEACTPWTMTLLRLVVAVILINHGWVKLFGESAQILAFFESTVLPMPGVLLIISGIIEFFGGLALILGLATRQVSLLIAIQFVVIVLFVKLKMGLTAMELDLLMLASLLAISSVGPGAFSLHRFLKTYRGSPTKTSAHGSEVIGG